MCTFRIVKAFDVLNRNFQCLKSEKNMCNTSGVIVTKSGKEGGGVPQLH